MAYVIGHNSGCHFNPAVTIGLATGKRFAWKEVSGYIMAQVLGGILAAAVLYLVVSGKPEFEAGGFAANGFGEHSLGGYNMLSAFIIELVLNFIFLIIILKSTYAKTPGDFAGIAIGLSLTLIHLISILVTNTSVNPARSTSQALFADRGWAMSQLWLYWLAPIAGALVTGLAYNFLSPEMDKNK